MTAPGSPARFVLASTLATALLALVALSVGSVWINPADVFRVIASHLTPWVDTPTGGSDAIVWNIRLPRVIVAGAVGAMLAAGASALQGTFRNPIIDAQLVGLSAFSAVGALVGFWLGYASIGPEAAIVGGAVVGSAGAWLVTRVANRVGAQPSRFVLVGVANGLALSALVATAAIAIHDPRIPDVTFWFFGGLSTATWTIASWIVVIAAITCTGIVILGPKIDILGLGDRAARHVGLDVRVVVAATTVFVGVGVGATVGAAGVIGFVGLVAARVTSHRVGPHHRVSIPASAALGALFLIAADTIGRLVGGGFEVPVGLVTTILGGLYLGWLVGTGKVDA